MRKPTFTILLIILLIVSALIANHYDNANAQSPEPPPISGLVEMRAYAPFDGAFKYGEWAPVWVELAYSGPDMRADLRITVVGSGGTIVFTTPVELPTGARKRLPIYALPNNFSRQLVVELVQGDQVLSTVKVAIVPNPTITYLVGLASPERGALSLLETVNFPGQTRPVRLVDVAISDIPEKFEGLRSFDLLVINSTDTSALTPEQLTALETWVRQGGRLVIGGGAMAAQTAGGLPASLLPLSNLQTVETDDLSGLESLAGPDRPVRVTGPFVLAQGTPQDGRALATQGDNSLVHEWQLDRGRVDWVALDVSGAPFDAWNGAVPLWESILTPGAVFPSYMPVDVSARQQFASSLSYPLSNLPMLDLPSVGGLAGLLGLYVLLVGPLNYIVLRRMKRLHLAWLTIPAITLLFSGASFGLGYALRGNSIFINKISVLQLQPSGKAQVISFVGLFTPGQAGYEVQVSGGGGLISPLGPFYDPWMSSMPPTSSGGRQIQLVQGDPAFVRGLSVEQWSMQSFMVEGMMMDFGTLESDLHLEGERLVGQVRSRSNYALSDVRIVLGTRQARLGDLAPGASAEVDIDMSAMSGPNFGPSISYMLFEDELSGINGPPAREVEVKRAIVENIFERVPPYITFGDDPESSQTGLYQTPVLIGWLDQAPPSVSVVGEQAGEKTTAVVVMALRYDMPESGAISLPVGMIPGLLVQNPLDGGACGMTGQAGVYMVRGEAIFEFRLPASLRSATVDSLKLNVFTDSGMFNAPTIAFYDWQNQRWLRLDGVAQGMNMIAEAGGLVNADGLVRIRLEAENAQSCYYLGLGLEGRR